MAGNWFRGGINKVNNESEAWSLDTIRASCVASPKISWSRDWTTLQDLQSAGNSLIPDALDIAMTTGAPVWIPSTDPGAFPATLMFTYLGPIAFGTPVAAQNVVGVVYHTGLSTDPANTIIWGFEDNVFTTGGGQLNWGVGGQNYALGISSIVGNSIVGRGFLADIEVGINPWSGATPFHYSLIRSTSPAIGISVADHQYVQDFIDDNFVFCTSTGPGEVNVPTRTQAQRQAPNYSGNSFLYQLTQGQPDLQWTHAAGLVDAEVISGVLIYKWTGSAATSRVYMTQAVTPNITIQAGKDIRYGDISGAASAVTQQSILF